MGIARSENGIFRLVVSLRHDADAARIEEWRASFRHASQMLFDATLGQHRFGEILVANNSMGAAEADCWLMEQDGASSSSHGFAQPGEHSTLMADERFRPFIILHEFSHYAYDVFDEYATGDGAPAECVGGASENACIMESGAMSGDRFGTAGAGGPLVEGRVKHFCVESNHDPDGDTRQEARRGHSCWQSMVGRFPELVMPTSPPPTSSPGNVPNINWVILEPEQRYVLVVDRSGSMAGAKLREAKSGCHWWIDNATIGDLLATTSFASTTSVDHALQAIASDADRQPHHDEVDDWVAGGDTAIGGALRTALDEIVGLGMRAASQVAVLLTDGLQTTGEAVTNVIPDLVDAGVRVYAIGVGSTIDEPLLNGAAAGTGGRFVRIDPSLSEADQSFAIRTALEELSFEVRDNGGVVTSNEASSEPGRATQRSVLIERGCTKATFLLSRRRFKDLLTLRLVDPSGAAFSVDDPGPGARVITSPDQPYVAIEVSNPRHGSWKIRVRASASNTQPAPFRLLVGSENADVGTAFHPAAPSYVAGQQVRLDLRVFAPFAVTRIKVKGALNGPRSQATSLSFRDDGRNGDAVADDGVHTATFTAPRAPGTYTIRAQVDATKATARFAQPDDVGDEPRAIQLRSVPSFTRTLETSFVVTKAP